MSSPEQHHALTPGRERATLLTLGAVQFTHILDYMIMMPLGAQLMELATIPKRLSVDIGTGQRLGVRVHDQAFLSSMALSTHSPHSSAICGLRTWRQMVRS